MAVDGRGVRKDQPFRRRGCDETISGDLRGEMSTESGDEQVDRFGFVRLERATLSRRRANMS